MIEIRDVHRADGGSNKALRGLRPEIDAFNASYAYTLDRGDIADWPGFFTADGRYRLTARENYEADLPIGLIYCDGRGMLIDRAAAIAETTTFAPRYLSHILSGCFVKEIDAEGLICTSTNYVVHQTLMEAETTILQAGEYIDRFAVEDGELLLKDRLCVYDTLNLPNSLIYPI